MSPDVSLAEFYVVGYRQRRVLEVTISFKDKAIIVQKVVLSSGIQDIFGPDEKVLESVSVFHQSLQFCACLSALLISVFCQVLTSGNYSRLCADILFARSMGYYIIQVSPSSIKYVAKIHIEVERFCLVTIYWLFFYN